MSKQLTPEAQAALDAACVSTPATPWPGASPNKATYEPPSEYLAMVEARIKRLEEQMKGRLPNHRNGLTLTDDQS